MRASLAAVVLASASLSQGTTWPAQTFVTETFTPPSLNITKTGQTQPGYLFFSPSGSGATEKGAVMMTDTNDLVWFQPTTPTGPQDFRVQQYNGSDVLVYWDGTATLLGGGYGQVHILDNTYTEILTICPNYTLYYANHKTFPCSVDVHEYYITDRNTILITGYNLTTADLTSVGGAKNGYVFDGLFFEIDLQTQKVLFRWSALDHLDKFPFTQSNHALNGSGTLATPWDFYHINSVQPVDGGYLVNSRFYFTLFKVNANDGSVAWRLQGSNGGDFSILPTTPPLYFSYEHHVRMLSNVSNILTISIFNNDNERPPANVNASTGLLVTLNTNPGKMTASFSRRLIDPSQPLISQSQGSYQDLSNGTNISSGPVFLGYGSLPITKEYNSSGAAVMTAQFGPGISATGYRSYRFPWSATPYYPPKVVAVTNTTTNLTDVWMSWNGATGIDSWNVYIGPKRKNLRIVAVSQRSGFETHTVINYLPNFVTVAAVSGGVEVSQSNITQPGTVS